MAVAHSLAVRAERVQTVRVGVVYSGGRSRAKVLCGGCSAKVVGAEYIWWTRQLRGGLDGVDA
jgi:hypothetical protein